MPQYTVCRALRNAGTIGVFSWRVMGPIEADSMEAAIEATRPDPDKFEGCGVLAEAYDFPTFAARAAVADATDGRRCWGPPHRGY